MVPSSGSTNQLTPLDPSAFEPSSATSASSGRRFRMVVTIARSARSSASETRSVALDLERTPAAGERRSSRSNAPASRAASMASASASDAPRALTRDELRADRGPKQLGAHRGRGRVAEVALEVVHEVDVAIAGKDDRVPCRRETLEDHLPVDDVAHPVVDAVERVLCEIRIRILLREPH